jgi:hypothetical protein
MHERTRVVAENEVLFRKLNEAGVSTRPAAERFSILCECGQSACLQRILVPRELYVRVRSIPTDFLLVSGHEDPAVETVLERHSGVIVVRKTGVGAMIAREDDAH